MKKKLFILFLVLMAVLTGCRTSPPTAAMEPSETTEITQPVETTTEEETTEPESSYEYTTVSRYDTEYRSGKRIMPPEVAMTTVNGRYYCFTPIIPEEERSLFIESQELLLTMLEEKGYPSQLKIIGILKRYTGWANGEGNTIYMDISEAHTWKHILFNLQIAMGEYTNYGYLYALSNSLADELGWETDAYHPAELAELAHAPYLLDLTYPCFLEGYVDKWYIDLAKSLAVALLEGCEDPFDQTQFLQARDDYAMNSGLAYTPTYLEFASAGISCPLKIRNQYYCLLVFGDYDPLSDGINYFEDYETLTSYLTRFDENIAYAAQYFAVEDLPIIEARLSPNIMEAYSEQVIGVFLSNDGRPFIKMNQLDCIVHEYVHYLYYTYMTEYGWDEDSSSWQNEALAYYFGITGNAVLFETYYRNPAKYAASFSWMVGHPYRDDWDSLYILHSEAVYSEIDPIEALNELDHDCGSFGAYIAGIYGEEILTRMMLHPSETEALTGHTMEQLQEQWQTLILELRNSEKKMDTVFP